MKTLGGTIRFWSTLLAFTLWSEATSAGVTVVGPGYKSCQEWQNAEQGDLELANNMKMWALGFLSGAAVFGRNVDTLRGLDSQAIWTWLDRYCSDHATAHFTQALRDYVAAHK